MLTALQRNQLTDVVAVVTRYFGGTKLGAGGLVRAYTEAVVQAVNAVGLRRVARSLLISVDVEFASAGAVEDQLRGLVLPSGTPVVVDGVDWSDRASIRLSVPASCLPEFDTMLAELGGGRLRAQPLGERWVDQGHA